MLALDTSALPLPAKKILDPASPPTVRAMAAKAIVPGLKPADVVTVVALLRDAEDPKVAESAKATFANLPAPILNAALGADLDPALVDRLAEVYLEKTEIIEKLLAMPRIAAETVQMLAERGSERITELVAVNETRLLEHPAIIEKLYMNKATRMSTADRLIDLAVRNHIELKGIPAFREAAAALEGELIAEPTEEPTPDDVAFQETAKVAAEVDVDPTKEDTHERNDEGEESVQKKVLPLHAMLNALPISGKIRRAMLGTAAERMLLVRDQNKLVASAAIRSPQVQEPEVVRISASRNVSDEVLRVIATNGEWTKNQQIKYNLVSNPRTPFVFASKLIPHLREDQLKQLERSRDVPSPVRQAAKQHLSRKGK